MKFGKILLGHSSQSSPEWAPFWLNYKSLKKLIKQVARVSPREANAHRNISDCAQEIAFFRSLQAELKKIGLFFSAEEKRFNFRYHQLAALLKNLQKKNDIEAFQTRQLLCAVVHFYRECIRLENFAVTNYQGFSKILKKHDKITGYSTRSKYMRHKVNHSTFSHYPLLLRILQNTEDLYHAMEKDVRMASAVANMNIDLHADVQSAPPASASRPLVPLAPKPTDTSTTPQALQPMASPTITPTNVSLDTDHPPSALWGLASSATALRDAKTIQTLQVINKK